MRKSMRIALMALLSGAALACLAAVSYEYVGPAEKPATKLRDATDNTLIAVTRAGDRLVGVGLRGLILYSDDQGHSWQQAEVPVSADLVAVSFPASDKGWAVGHDGVVLHSSDGGATWVKQLDAERLAELQKSYYASADDESVDEAFKQAARQVRVIAEQGLTRALLDVHFINEQSGFAVGAFNQILRTDDGGRTWTPWMHRSDNPKAWHFYSITPDADSDDLYLTGEQGLTWRLAAGAERFVVQETPYDGTLFGMVASGDVLLAYGMRGTLLRSEDRGESWSQRNLDTAAGITDGVMMPDRRIVLVSQAGRIRVSGDLGASFVVQPTEHAMPYYGVASVGQGRLGLVGAAGIATKSLD